MYLKNDSDVSGMGVLNPLELQLCVMTQACSSDWIVVVEYNRYSKILYPELKKYQDC